jgi:hypothetical protein
MSHETLMCTFANAGERFVYRTGFRAEQARWQNLNPPLRLVPNSQFGIGVFSYFMIAEEIEIVTRPVNEEDLIGAHAYSVRIASSGSLFQIVPSADLPSGGTRVRLYLTGEDRLSVLRTMRWLLWIAEFRVDVCEDGTSETWLPERLRYPGASVPPLRHGADLWWVPGEGGLAADGIRTNKTRYGLVVNLRGIQRPQFTVDRNRLRRWNKDWVAGRVRESLSALMKWPGLTLSWLWKVTETAPAVAQDIFAQLIKVGYQFPAEGLWGGAEQAPASRVGCLPVDRALFNGEMNHIWNHTSNLWLTGWRAGAWKGIVSSFGLDHVAEVTRLDGFPLVGPLDANVLGEVYDAGRYIGSSAEYGHPSVDDLLRVAADEDESPAVRLSRLRRYAITGLDLTAARQIPLVHSVFRSDPRSPADKSDDAEEEALLIAVAAWAPPDAPTRVAAGGWLAKASSALHIPLGEVLRRAGALVPADWTPPVSGDIGALRDYVCTSNDVKLFSGNRYGEQPWIDPVVPPAEILRASSVLGHPVAEVLDMFDRFAVLGYRVAERDGYPQQLSSAEYEALRQVENVGDQLTPLHILMIAGRTGRTARQVHRDLCRLVDAGLLTLPDEGTATEAVTTEDERRLISEELYRPDSFFGRYRMATGWLAVRTLAGDIGSPKLTGFEDRLSRYRRLLDVVDLRRPVTVPEIVDLAFRNDLSIAAAVNFYQRLFPATADLSRIPAVALSSAATCRYEERLVLLGNDFSFDEHEVYWSLRPACVVSGSILARRSITAFLDWVEPFRELGAPLPTLDEATRQLLDDPLPDRYDRAMLFAVDQRSGHEKPVDVITPLRLMQVAGRFGWTLRQAHDRMARLQPLGLRLHYQAGVCPDEIVSWQDLLLVTQHLDGQEPVVAGQVAQSHLESGAEEVNESVDEVRTRLRRYAPLFGFSLNEEAG